MVKTTAVLICLLAAASATEISAGGIYNLTQGFLIGLEANPKAPGPCYKALEGISGDFEAIASDISRIAKGDEAAVTQLLTDVTGTVHDLRAFNGTCDFSTLEAQLKELLSPEGAKTISENYLKHVIVINRDISTLKECSANYYSCGKAAGEIFRLIVQWNLNTPHLKGTQADTENFFNGLITGLQGATKSVCSTDLLALNTDVNDLIENIIKVINGDYSGLPSLLMAVKTLDDKFKKVDGECSLSSLFQKIESMMGPGVHEGTHDELLQELRQDPN